jgi:hypothetical protein
MITIRSIYFFVILAVFLSGVIGAGAHYYFRYRRASKFPYGNFEVLLKKLVTVDHDKIAMIARDFVDESGHRRTDEDDLDLDPSQIYPLVGGLQGLEVLEKNCAVLIDLAFYVQQWYPEALGVAEQLRLHAREIEWHVDRLKRAEKIGKLESSFADNAQRVIATYYVMTRHVLALYEHFNIPGNIELQRAL